ncbi:hypothetical protein L0F63_002778, partial [Massospora cicadina]
MAKRKYFCGSIVIIVALVGAAVTAFFLWARMPEVKFNNVVPPENRTQSFESQTLSEFHFNFRLNLTIDNPNYVGVMFTSIEAKGSLPQVSDTQIGEGMMKDVHVSRLSKTVILFPVQVNYRARDDKKFDTLFYIATKCGLLKEAKSSLKIKYTVTASVKVVAVSVNLPAFHNDVDVDCPIPPNTKIP